MPWERAVTYMFLWHEGKEQVAAEEISLVNHCKQDPPVPPCGLGFSPCTTSQDTRREQDENGKRGKGCYFLVLVLSLNGDRRNNEV